MLTDAATDCGPQDVGTFPPFGWSEIAAKPSRRGGGSQPDFCRYIVKMYVKTSLIDVVYEVKKDLQDVSAEVCITKLSTYRSNFFLNFMS
jgi:hypothetical protein